MDRIVECVPNFSEGRRRDRIERIVAAIESVPEVAVLDVHADADHNRSVVTFIASPERVVEAAVRAVACAKELIDLRQHTGLHPRIGAADVVPFVPLRNVSMEECVELAHEAGERIWNELNIPVYFYERAALRPDRVNLEDVRRGGFERLREAVQKDAARAPDIGEARLHETAGACIVGARPLLIAFNVYLRTEDAEIARRIARAVRGRDGGLRFLKALGFKLDGRGMAQVSMNLTDYERTTLHHAFEAVRREAARYGVTVASSEIVGLVPQTAFDLAVSYWLQLENDPAHVTLERRIAATLERREHAPLHALFAIELARLIDSYQKRPAADQTRESCTELEMLRQQLEWAARALMQQDERAAEGDEAAMTNAISLALEVMSGTAETLAVLETLAEDVEMGHDEAEDWKTDLARSAQLARALVEHLRFFVRLRAGRILDEEFRAEHRARADDLVERARESVERIENALLE
jgi:glutamate formiminotransferase